MTNDDRGAHESVGTHDDQIGKVFAVLLQEWLRFKAAMVTFDVFEGEDRRDKNVEYGYDTFAVPCDWREDAEQSNLIEALREFREIVRRKREEALR